MLFFMFINVKMPTIVGILTFMSRKNVMLNSEHEKSFITSGSYLFLWVSLGSFHFTVFSWGKGNSVSTDQTPHVSAFELGLHCFQYTLRRISGLERVNTSGV